MAKKSRIIINNWSSLSDSMAAFYVSQSIRGGEYKTRRFTRPTGARLLVAVFHNKSSYSFDVRDIEEG